LSGLERLLLWGYSRKSLAYELLWAALLAFLALVSPGTLGDPMHGWGS
jgi:hypothetical protein